MADYVTIDELSPFTHELTGSTTVTDLLLTSASRLFDNLTEVPEDFYKAAPNPVAYSSRVFYGDGTAYLRLDPFTALNTVTPVVVDAAFTYALPVYVTDTKRFQLIDAAHTKRLSDDFLPVDRYTGWQRSVAVTVSANWGFAAIPADLKIAVIHLAIHQWRTADPAFATISNAEGAAARSRTIPQIAQVTIDKYKRMYSRAAMFA
jgi:hypothetical protein